MKRPLYKEITKNRKTCLSVIVLGAQDGMAGSEGSAFVGLASHVKARSRAFTLIELLVVIAIIAILAAILMPVLSRAKARGLMIAEVNNFKQLQTCYLMYVHDNNDKLPLNFGNGSSAQGLSWVQGSAQKDWNTTNIQNGVLFEYNEQVKIYQCPANTFTVTKPAGGPGTSASQVPQTRTCSVEGSMGGNSANDPNGPWIINQDGVDFNSYGKMTMLQATRVAAKIVFADEAESSLDDGTFGLYPLGTPEDTKWWNIPCTRHNNGTVWSFADGHAEYWKWHGTVLIENQMDTPLGTSGGVTGDSSDDLPRTQTGGAQYP